MKLVTYKGVDIRTNSCNEFFFFDPTTANYYDYVVKNGGRPIFIARSILGKSFGRNSASAIRGMQRMIDDDMLGREIEELAKHVEAVDTFVFNPNARRKTGRAKEERGGGRRNKVRGKKAK